MKTVTEFGIYLIVAVLIDVVVPQINVGYLAGYLAFGVLGGLLYKNAKGNVQKVIGTIFIVIQILGLIGNLI